MDVCCLNRPFDDQTQDKIHLETEAIVTILKYVKSGKLKIIGSDIIEFEISKTPDPVRRSNVESFAAFIEKQISIDEQIIKRGKELQKAGFKGFDALHIACAEKGKAEVLLTTDDKLIKLASRNSSLLSIKVDNPLNWVQENLLK